MFQFATLLTIKKFLDTNNRHQKITDPLLMQRVLYEILRRSCDTERSIKKRKHETLIRKDRKFAEEMYDRETRGARPGMMDFTIKRKRTEDWDTTASVKKMYTSVY